MQGSAGHASRTRPQGQRSGKKSLSLSDPQDTQIQTSEKPKNILVVCLFVCLYKKQTETLRPWKKEKTHIENIHYLINVQNIYIWENNINNHYMLFSTSGTGKEEHSL